MNSSVQQIKERLSIEEVISSYLKLEKAGANLKAKCPFHNEKTASFFISPGRESYYCFGCGAKGDIFTFVEEFEGLDFKGALKLLAERAGVSLAEFRKEDPENSEKEKVYRIMEAAAGFFRGNMGKEAMEYLKERGIADKTVEEWQIGFAKPEWRALYDSLKGKWKEEDLEKAGLIKKSEKGYYDRFRGRIMFPINDSSGRVIAFSGRIFPHSDQEAKYMNSPETPIFKKSSVLYGIDKAKDSIRKNDFSIVVEGQLDLLMSHQAGFRNTVATMGTALSDLGLIKRFSQNIVFVFDSDKAGFAAAMRAASLALSQDMNVKGADTGEGYDPADLVLKKGPDAWRGVIRNSKHIIEFLLDKTVSAGKDPLKTKLEVEEKIIPYLLYIDNPVKKSHFISAISHRTGIREEDIRESLKKKSVSEAGESPVVPKKESVFRKDYILRRLLGIALWQQGLEKPALSPKDILSEIGRIMEVPSDELVMEAKDEAADLIFEAEVFYGQGEDISKDAREMLSNLEEEHLKAKLAGKLEELQRAESKTGGGSDPGILKEISEINSRIQNIKSGRLKK